MERSAAITRKTKETDITIELNLDQFFPPDISTGIGFFDHMLTALSVHSGIGMKIHCIGDLEVDCHHTIEDTGIVLGQALNRALHGDLSGQDQIKRYGSASIPMDEALATAVLDLSGRAYLVFHCEFSSHCIGSMDTQMFEEFFRALAVQAKMTLHLNVDYGTNDHHKAEALFKAFAHALKTAVQTEERKMILSTKGVLESF